ncbi:hypothetical protein V502_02124 [Pseudogymnoascus sp. VKM F-4520 (FW-2644)]|nr:hypothetical protein V502_02124 [Pseudogymnoascus sp. VKM F-4520 (FW-2644)]
MHLFLGAYLLTMAAKMVVGSKVSKLSLFRIGDVSYYATQSSTGVIPWSPLFDSLGVFSRDLDSYVSAAKVLHAGSNQNHCTSKLKKILYPLDFWPVGYAESQTVEWAPSMTVQMREKGIEQLAVFKKWVQSDILPVDEHGCSEKLLLLPWTFGQPDYRELYCERPTWIGKGFFWYYISSCSQAPEMMLPIGQTRYKSRVTGAEEWLPVSIGVIASKDNDIMLAELIQEMYHSSGLNTSVMTGRTAFEMQDKAVGKAKDATGQAAYLENCYKTRMPASTLLALAGPIGHVGQVGPHARLRKLSRDRMYGNEKEVGEAIRRSGLKRSDVFITTKINSQTGEPEKTYQRLLESVCAIDGEHGYVDLFLIHSSMSDLSARKELYQALERLLENGKTRSIGVSNWGIGHIEELKGYAKVFPPHVNQIELHPFNQQREIVAYCHENQMVVQAYSPLVRNKKAGDPTLNAIAKTHNKTVAQVLIRYCLQKNWVPLPKSDTPSRIVENIDVYDFELSQNDMHTLDNLHQGPKGSVVKSVLNEV